MCDVFAVQLDECDKLGGIKYLMDGNIYIYQ